MPQKSPGLRKYGHDLADEDPHFLGGLRRVLLHPARHRHPEAAHDLADEEATPLNCGVATMVSVTEAAAIGMGDTVVIQGLGLLGLYGAAMAKSRGARLVIGLDDVPDAPRDGPAVRRRHHLRRRRHDDRASWSRAVRTACRPDGADVVIEVCGVPDVIPAGLRMLRAGGRYMLAGFVNPNADVTIDANMLVRSA